MFKLKGDNVMKKIILFTTFLFVFCHTNYLFTEISELNQDEKIIEQIINVENLKELLDEIKNERSQTKKDIFELEEVKDSIVNEIKQEFLNLQSIEQTKSFYKEEKTNSSDMNNALNEVISLKVLKMLDEMTKDEKDGIFKTFLKGTWNHKYSIFSFTVITFIILVVVNNRDIMDRVFYEITKRGVDNTAGAIGGSARGGWDAFKNLWQR